MALMLPVTVPTLNFDSSVSSAFTFPLNTEMSRTDVRPSSDVPIGALVGGWFSKFGLPLKTLMMKYWFCKAVDVPRKTKGSRFSEDQLNFPSFQSTLYSAHLLPLDASEAESLGMTNLRHFFSLCRFLLLSSISRFQFSGMSWKSKTSSKFTVQLKTATSETGLLFFFFSSNCSLVSFSLIVISTFASRDTMNRRERVPMP
mmetsp:Transcript_39916/g.105589  ORF Transcript_39916/g.105589 Transcript_39916/m.105589 type:complete len:201 (+) Transcript_39916:222-824(+)